MTKHPTKATLLKRVKECANFVGGKCIGQTDRRCLILDRKHCSYFNRVVRSLEV